MNNRITFYQAAARLEENSLAYEVLNLQEDFRLIILKRGGRILGPFCGDDGESILWINGNFSCKEAFRKFLESGDWNLGGDRIWIAPELQYNVKDRNDFYGSYSLPVQVDPGSYSIARNGSMECVLKQDMKLELYGVGGTKELQIERRMRSAADPLQYLKHYSELAEGVLYSGFQHKVFLKEEHTNDILSEAWNLTQVNPGGQMFIPVTPEAEYTDYYEPVDNECQLVFPGHIRLEITGVRRYKAGYKAVNVLGRIGYYNTVSPDKACLLVRQFFSNPSAPYTKEPVSKPGCAGHSLHVYNDNGENGGFAELECSGQPIGGTTGKSCSEDDIITWLYIGDRSKVKNIAYCLLGVKI